MNWRQLQTIFWLRWRLMCNQSSRSGGLGAILAVFLALMSAVLGAACFAGGLLAGIFGLAQSSPAIIMGVWLGVTLGFLFFWFIGLLNELQRSEAIDLQRLMHLPVALGQMFVINYVVSHFTLAIILVVPAMLGLAVGLTISRGPAMVLMAPLALGMVFMITAWTYCLRSWLAGLMSNPRRRRTVIMVATLVFILVAQGPNLYFNVLNRAGNSGASREERRQHDKARSAAMGNAFKQLKSAEKFIPPLWVPLGAQELAEGRPVPALLGTLGCLGLGVLGLRRAYRGILVSYLGKTGGKSASRPAPAVQSAKKTSREKAGAGFLEWRLGPLPEQATALALAEFRSMLRAPEVKMMLAGALFSVIFIGALLVLRLPAHLSETVKPFIATGTAAFSVFMSVQFLSNQFGLDRDGFRSLILSPADRRHILMGKNLAALTLTTGLGLLMLVLVSAWLHLSWMAFVAGLFQFFTMLLGAALTGNLLSIYVPYRIQPGSLKPTKMPALATLTMIFCNMFFSLVTAPGFIPPLAGYLWNSAGLPEGVPVNLILSVVIAALAALIYWEMLGPLGRLLQRRETKILAVVTVEVE